MWVNGLAEVIKVLIVPLIVAFVAAIFGVRQGLQQARHQRAFDRRLEWYEKTIRAIDFVLDTIWKLRNAMPVAKREEISILFRRLEKEAGELKALLSESMLFADRARIVELRETLFDSNELVIKLRDITAGKEKISEGQMPDCATTASYLARDLRKLRFSLAQTVRKELKLDEISPDDLLTEQEKVERTWREEQRQRQKEKETE